MQVVKSLPKGHLSKNQTTRMTLTKTFKPTQYLVTNLDLPPSCRCKTYKSQEGKDRLPHDSSAPVFWKRDPSLQEVRADGSESLESSYFSDYRWLTLFLCSLSMLCVGYWHFTAQSKRSENYPHEKGRLQILQSGKVRWYVDEFLYGAICTRSNVPIRSPLFSLGVDEAGRELQWELAWAPRDYSSYHYSIYLTSVNAAAEPYFSVSETNFTLALKGGKQEPRYAFCHRFDKYAPAWGRRNVLNVAAAKSVCRKDGSVCVELHMAQLAPQVSGPPVLVTLQPSTDTELHIVLVSEHPRIFVLDNFLSTTLCEKLAALALPDLKRSKVAAGQVSNNRTSYGTFLTEAKEQEPVVVAVEANIANVLSSPIFRCDGRKQLRRSEALQVVRYQKGEFYNEHYDNKAGDASHRAATFMVYLTDVAAGGATYFPRAKSLSFTAQPLCNVGKPMTGLVWNSKGPGLRILPKKGRAVLFWSRNTMGKEDLASVHAAEAVKEGEKWIMTRWLQEEN